MKNLNFYEKNQIVLGKVLGYDWWPGIVKSPKNRNNEYKVEFIGWPSYSILPIDKIKLFDPTDKINYIKSKGKLKQKLKKSFILAKRLCLKAKDSSLDKSNSLNNMINKNENTKKSHKSLNSLLSTKRTRGSRDSNYSSLDKINDSSKYEENKECNRSTSVSITHFDRNGKIKINLNNKNEEQIKDITKIDYEPVFDISNAIYEDDESSALHEIKDEDLLLINVYNKLINLSSYETDDYYSINLNKDEIDNMKLLIENKIPIKPSGSIVNKDLDDVCIPKLYDIFKYLSLITDDFSLENFRKFIFDKDDMLKKEIASINIHSTNFSLQKELINILSMLLSNMNIYNYILLSKFIDIKIRQLSYLKGKFDYKEYTKLMSLFVEKIKELI